MPRPYWIAAIAVAVVLLGEPYAGWAQEEGQPQGQQIQIPPPAFGLTNEAEKPDKLTEPCEPGSENRSSDLCAQWKAADAAQESAYWSGPYFWIGLIGGGVSGLTLIAAVVAAAFAGSAAKAAWATVNATRQIGDTQLRPYLVFMNASLDGFKVLGKAENERHLLVDMTFRNCGQTPAIITASSSTIYAPNERGQWTSVRAGYGPKRMLVGPNQTEKIRFDATASDETGNFSTFFIGVLLWYDNLVGTPFEDYVWLYFDGRELRQDYPTPNCELYRPESG